MRRVHRAGHRRGGKRCRARGGRRRRSVHDRRDAGRARGARGTAAMMQAGVGAALAAAIALIAHRARSLSASGAIAAFAVGTIVFGAAGWRGAAVLFAFFIPSALISRRGAAGAPRSGWQVLANGGVAACCALLSMRFGAAFSAGFAGAFAAASADTWGTEIGTRVAQTPVSILTFRPVAVGRSGGVTLAGSLATLGGALCVPLAAAAVGVAPLVGRRRRRNCRRAARLDPRREPAGTALLSGVRARLRDAVPRMRRRDAAAARCELDRKRRGELCGDAVRRARCRFEC